MDQSQAVTNAGQEAGGDRCVGGGAQDSDTAIDDSEASGALGAFEAVVALHKDRVYGYLYRMIGSRDDAEDLTQEVFVRAFANRHTFRAETSTSSWLFLIAHRLALDIFRRRKVRGVVASLDTPHGEETGAPMAWQVPDWSSEPLTHCCRQELNVRLEEAIAALSPKMRSALLLHFVEELPLEEIAAIEAVPLGTVKSRIFHARDRVRQHLRPYLEI